jgi:hypothetical protein
MNNLRPIKPDEAVGFLELEALLTPKPAPKPKRGEQVGLFDNGVYPPVGGDKDHYHRVNASPQPLHGSLKP